MPELPHGTSVRYFGDYVLIGEIARGGMGVVWRARQVSLNRPVALKLIQSGCLATQAEVQRFRTEAEAAASLDHPNIVPIYEIGEHEGQHYFTMKLVEGQSLAEQLGDGRWRIQDDNTNDRQRYIALLMTKIARAVHHAHQRGVLHRDLKPSNIVIDERDEPHVTDFGLAKLLEHSHGLTRTTAVMGTPAYMAPEQATGATKRVTTATDVYGLGAILYELLTHQPPFRGESQVEILQDVQNRDPSPPQSLVPEVNSDLQTICLKCLEKEPQRRYGSALELAEDLTRWSEGHPILARPVKRWEKVGKWARRNPAVAGLTAGVFMIAVLGVAGIFWQWRNAEDARAVAVSKARDEARSRIEADRGKGEAQKAKEESDKQRALAEQGLTRIQMQRAEDLFVSDDASTALAYLAHVLRTQPTNEAVAERILSALTYRNFLLPIPEFFHHDEGLTALFQGNGERVMTISANDVRVWDVHTGQPIASQPIKEPIKIGNQWPFQVSPDGRRILLPLDNRSAQVWDVQSGKSSFPPLRHQAFIAHAEFSPDGRRIVTASFDKTARIWDAETGQAVFEPLLHEAPVVFAQFSPDGRRLVTSLYPDAAQLWDAKTGQQISPSFKHDSRVHWPPQFSPDGRWLLVASNRVTGLIVESQTGATATAPLGSSGAILYVKFSPNGQRLVSSSRSDSPILTELRLWDVRAGHSIAELLRQNFEGMVGTASSGYRGFSGYFGKVGIDVGSDGAIRLYKAQDGSPVELEDDEVAQALASILNGRLGNLGHPDRLPAQFSPGGCRVLGFAGPTFAIWDAQDGQKLAESLKHPGAVKTAQFHPNGRELVSVSERATGGSGIRLWSGEDALPLSEFDMHHSRVRSLQFSPTESRLLVVSEEFPETGTSARLWDTRPGAAIGTTVSSSVQDSDFSPDGRVVATVLNNGSLQVWDLKTGKQAFESPESLKDVRSVWFNQDGSRLLVVSFGDLRVLSAKSGKLLTEPLEFAGHLKFSGHIKDACFSPDGHLIVTASARTLEASGNKSETSARIWDAQTLEPVSPRLELIGVTGRANVRFSPNNRRILALIGQRGRVQIYDAPSGTAVSELYAPGYHIKWAQFSPDGLRVLTTSGDNTAAIWDVQAARIINKEIHHKDTVNVAVFSPNGDIIATASDDQSARIWNAQTGAPLIEPLDHGVAVTYVRFSPDGRRILTGTRDGKARVWDTDSGKPCSEWFKLQAPLGSAVFNKDGNRLLTQTGGTVCVWDLGSAFLPGSERLPELAEAVGGQRLNERGLLEPVPVRELLEIRKQILGSPASDSFALWAKWFFDDRAVRKCSPRSWIAIPEFINHSIEEATRESLELALRLSPTNGAICARLAYMVGNNSSKPRRDCEKEFLSLRASILAPNDSRVKIEAPKPSRPGNLRFTVE